METLGLELSGISARTGGEEAEEEEEEEEQQEHEEPFGLYRKLWCWGLGGGLGGHFTVNLNQSVAQKPRRISLFHFGLVAFNFHFAKNRKVIIFFRI